MPGTAKLKARLITISSGQRAAAEHVVPWRSSTSAAPRMPKIAPDAPTVDAVRVHDQRARPSPRGRRRGRAEEPHRPEVALERPADPPEREHVQAEVDGAVVEERGGDQPPPVAVRDQRARRARPCSKIQPPWPLIGAPPASWSR